MSLLDPAIRRLEEGGAVTLARAPEGYDAFVVAELTRALAKAGVERAVTLAFVARDGLRAQSFIDALSFAAPEIEALHLPSWDCQPYDRVSPNAGVSAERMTVLARLARTKGAVERPRILVGSVSALTQRVPPLKFIASAAFSAAPGNSVRMDDLARWLEGNGYARASTVRDVGDYASRGGILDLYPPGAAAPIRLDFFGDTLESIRAFDPETQRSTGQLRSLDLVPMSEARLTTESIRRFRQLYAQEFGAPSRDDDLYAAVSEGRRAIGLEHWLPLLYESLDTLFDYVGKAPFVLDARAEDAAHERIALIADNYAARRAAYADDPVKADYKPLPFTRLYMSEDEWKERLAAEPLARLTPFEPPPGARDAVDCGGRTGRNFAPERQSENANVFDAAVAHVRALRARGMNVIVAGWSDGSRERLSHVLAEHGLKSLEFVSSYHQAEDGARRRAAARRDRPRAGVRSAGLRRHRRAGHPRRPAHPPVEAQAARAGCAGGGERAHRRRPRRSHRPWRRALRRPSDDRGGGRAARLPRNPLCRRRPAVPAGRKSRAPVALRLGDRRAR